MGGDFAKRCLTPLINQVNKNMSLSINGVGMTSQRIRDRLINILKQYNIKNENVLNIIATINLFLFFSQK